MGIGGPSQFTIGYKGGVELDVKSGTTFDIALD
jgi:recombinational DNA repair protein RecT